jgi:predicted PhzF superfamily epimerase YddE/YHI9/ribosomal protein S18 acetylase RimI-like enzyme
MESTAVPVIKLELCSAADVWVVAALESASYPDDEAAAPATVAMRQQVAGTYFRVLKDLTTGELVGFVNGTCIVTDEIHHESMSEHRAEGTTLVIHSVTVAPAHRRRKVGRSMVVAYVRALATECPELRRVLLLSKGYLLRFYMDCGFTLVKLSPVAHGRDDWFEMALDLGAWRKAAGAVEQYTVDAFTDTPFAGNPAAVVFAHRDPAWMVQLAAENNLSETAFVAARSGVGVPAEGNTYDFDLRWFTPTSEIDLCGHATLATAHALIESGRVRCSPVTGGTSSDSTTCTIRFHTLKSGILTAAAQADGTIVLDFPATAPTETTLSAEETGWLHQALHVRNDADVLYVGRSVYDLLVELTPEAFDRISPVDTVLLRRLGGRGVIVTRQGSVGGGGGHDFTSRCFFPCVGIDEDPVTGSAHCALAPYWVSKFKSTAGAVLKGYQASTRGGVVKVSLADGPDGPRVLLAGPSVTVIKSTVL